MRLIRGLVAAAIVLVTPLARAQLDDSYTDPNAPAAPASTAPLPAPRPPPPKVIVRVVERMPKRLKYESDDRIPLGYHVEDKTGDGLIVAGSIVSVLSAAVVGLGLPEATNGRNDGEFDGAGVLVGAVGLAVGLPLLLSGASYTPHKVLVRNDASVNVAPAIAQHTLGGSVAVAF